MTFDVNSHPLQHRQPHITKRSVFRKNQMLAEFEIGPTTGKDSRAIGQVVNGADVLCKTTKKSPDELDLAQKEIM